MTNLKRKLTAAVAASGLALSMAALPATAQQDADGLVVVQIDDTNVNVTVPINAAVALAANVCGVVVDANVLAAVDEQNTTYGPVDCESNSRAFADQALTITNNN